MNFFKYFILFYFCFFIIDQSIYIYINIYINIYELTINYYFFLKMVIRSCAVYGGVYMLDQTISSLELKEDKYHINCEYNFTSDHLITSIDYLQDMSNIE